MFKSERSYVWKGLRPWTFTRKLQIVGMSLKEDECLGLQDKLRQDKY